MNSYTKRILSLPTSEAIDALLPESSSCPICGVKNIPWCDIVLLEQVSGVEIDEDSPEFQGEQLAIGTACWDAPFGDTCGSCRSTIINTETALVGPNGYCH